LIDLHTNDTTVAVRDPTMPSVQSSEIISRSMKQNTIHNNSIGPKSWILRHRIHDFLRQAQLSAATQNSRMTFDRDAANLAKSPRSAVERL